MIERIKALVGDQVQEVRATHRLTESPACLVYGEGDVGVQMRKILAAAGQAVPDTRPVLEVNLRHALVARLQDETDDGRATDLAGLLYDQAALAAGNQLENPALFVQRLNRLLFSAG